MSQCYTGFFFPIFNTIACFHPSPDIILYTFGQSGYLTPEFTTSAAVSGMFVFDSRLDIS